MGKEIQPVGGQVVSIHAPARGATMRLFTCGGTFTSFNPRTREGCDGE